MAFDFGLWSDGVSPMLFVCEEAHRYASADRSIGFGPTRKAVSRIAKEGRKYGVYLALVTQRPAELDATIISQCNTLFAMRLANERDQMLLRSAVSDAAANLLSFVPSLGTREVLAFGEGVPLPTRLRFKEVPAHQLPRSEATIATTPSAHRGHDVTFVSSVLERWRGATSHRETPNDPVFDRTSRNVPFHGYPKRRCCSPRWVTIRIGSRCSRSLCADRQSLPPAIAELPCIGVCFASGTILHYGSCQNAHACTGPSA